MLRRAEIPLKESYKGIALGGKIFIEKINKKIKRVGKKKEIMSNVET